MSTLYKLSGGIEVTRFWTHGRYLWTVHSDTFDAGQIAELFALLDPVVGDALLKAARDREIDSREVAHPEDERGVRR